jgi:uncharacterized protein DUF4886
MAKASGERWFVVVAAIVAVAAAAMAQTATSVLFIGNSFTYGAGSPVQFYRSSTVTDLNGEGIGGVPALFKAFAAQAGLVVDVSLETRGGTDLGFHLANKRPVLSSRSWDKVVMQSHSLLDIDKPGDPTKMIAAGRDLAEMFRSRNPKTELYLTATWSRADQTYVEKGAWFGKPIEAMARDLRAGTDKAAAAAKVKAVIPVGEAWNRAIQKGVADPNPYDGVDDGKLDLWAADHYHASTAGYYLEALVVFGSLTGIDPRVLGDTECTAFELSLTRPQVKALQQIAFDELTVAHAITRQSPMVPKRTVPVRCESPR